MHEYESRILARRYRKDPSIVSRNIAGEVILVPIQRRMGDLENIFMLNPTAASAWSLIDGERTLGEIVDAMTQEFDVKPEEAASDMCHLMEQLESMQAVERV